MFETPRIVPHERVDTPAEGETTTQDLDMSQYGDSLDPQGFMRVKKTDLRIDPDRDGDSD